MQTTTKQLWASVFAAMAGSLCCFAPLVLIALGISGAWIGHLTALEPHRPVSIGVMLVFLGLAFRQLYIVPARCSQGEACANPRLQRRQRQVLWTVIVGFTALIASRGMHRYSCAKRTSLCVARPTVPCPCWACRSPPAANEAALFGADGRLWNLCKCRWYSKMVGNWILRMPIILYYAAIMTATRLEQLVRHSGVFEGKRLTQTKP